MLEVHAILQRQRCNENITKKTGTLSDAYEVRHHDGKEAETAEPEASQVICLLLLSIKIGAPSVVGDAPFRWQFVVILFNVKYRQFFYMQ